MAGRPVKSKLINKYPVAEKWLKVFANEAQKWIKRFNLNDFQVYYIQEDMEGCYAACCADMPGMSASLILNKSWPEPPTEDVVRHSARHEAIELLFQPMWHAVLTRCLNEDWANSQRHGAIRRLENLFDGIEFNG